ncbi:MAG: InlB B-repeat-containing protein [Propionibacteriaceae bacterium]|nr:InlB B-repeat-containing protein [Propionibacteriaceae bacterium]
MKKEWFKKSASAAAVLTTALAVPFGSMAPATASPFILPDTTLTDLTDCESEESDSEVTKESLTKLVNSNSCIITIKEAAAQYTKTLANTFQSEAEKLVTEAVNAAFDKYFTADVINKALDEQAGPLLKQLAKDQLTKADIDSSLSGLLDDAIDSAIDQVITSDVIGTILSNDIVQDVTQRTIKYTIANLMADLNLEQVLADKVNSLIEARQATAIDAIFNTATTEVAGTEIKGSLIAQGGNVVNNSYYDVTIGDNDWNIDESTQVVPIQVDVPMDLSKVSSALTLVGMSLSDISPYLDATGFHMYYEVTVTPEMLENGSYSVDAATLVDSATLKQAVIDQLTEDAVKETAALQAAYEEAEAEYEAAKKASDEAPTGEWKFSITKGYYPYDDTAKEKQRLANVAANKYLALQAISAKQKAVPIQRDAIISLINNATLDSESKPVEFAKTTPKSVTVNGWNEEKVVSEVISALTKLDGDLVKIAPSLDDLGLSETQLTQKLVNAGTKALKQAVTEVATEKYNEAKDQFDKVIQELKAQVQAELDDLYAEVQKSLGDTQEKLAEAKAEYDALKTEAINSVQELKAWAEQAEATITKWVAIVDANWVKTSIKGDTTLGSKLTADTKTIVKGARVTYQWYRNGTDIKGETKSKYKLTEADGGTTISVEVTATAFKHTKSAKADKSIALYTIANFTPAISGATDGKAEVKAQLGVNGIPDAWKKYATYQWLRDGQEISTDPTYTTSDDDIDKEISVNVTLSKDGYAPKTASASVTVEASSSESGDGDSGSSTDNTSGGGSTTDPTPTTNAGIVESNADQTSVEVVDNTEVNSAAVVKAVKLKLNVNGGKLASSKKTKTVTTTKKYGTLATPTRSGYTFLGWYTKKSGGTKVTSKTVVTVAKTHTLYAHWAKKTTYAKVTVGTLQVNSKATSLVPKAIGYLKKGTSVKVLSKVDRPGTKKDFYKISYKGKTGYIAARYVKTYTK